MFDNSVVEVIKSLSIYGLTIVALSSFVKTGLQKVFKTTANWTGYLASVLSSAGFTAYYLISQHAFGIVSFIGYTLIVCLTGNVLFKSVHSRTNPN